MYPQLLFQLKQNEHRFFSTWHHTLDSTYSFFLPFLLLGLTAVICHAQVTEEWARRYSLSFSYTNIEASSMTIDAHGNVYVTGNSLKDEVNKDTDIITIKFSADGKQQWIKSFNGESSLDDKAGVIALDNSGNVYITGTSRVFDANYNPETITIIKYTNNGQEQWVAIDDNASPYGTYPGGITIDGSGNVYVIGNIEGGPYGALLKTVKYSANGTKLWQVNYDPPFSLRASSSGIAVDGSGNVYVTGSSEGNGTSTDYITFKYNSTGTELWMQRYNGPANGEDIPTGIRVDSQGNVYISGSSAGAGTSMDFATVKYTTNGTQQWVQRYTNHDSNTREQVFAMALDAQGNVYVTGTSSTNLNTYATVKYNSSGIKQWDWVKTLETIFIDAGSEEKATAMAVDGQGNVYVTGISSGKKSFLDYTTIKYSPTGIELWVSKYNGPVSWNDYPTAIALDAQGNIYVTGYSYVCHTSSDVCDPLNPNSYFQVNYATVKYSTDGTQQWVRMYDGGVEMDDKASALAIDGSGNIYVTGTSFGNDGNGYYSFDYATIKYNSAGTQLWVKRSNPSSAQGYDDQATAIALDVQDNVFVTGISSSGSNKSDYATVKYTSNGTLQWAKMYNGPANGKDIPVGIKVDGGSNVYVAGTSAGSTTGEDYALVKYTASGSQAWVKRYHSSSADQAKDLAVDKSGSIYVTGVSRGYNNGVVYRTLKYNPAGTVQWIKSYGDGTYPGTTQQVALAVDAESNVYLAGSDSLTAQARFVVIKYDTDGSQLWQHSYQSTDNSTDQTKALVLDGHGNIYVTGSSNNDYLTLKLRQNTLPAPWKNQDIGAVALAGSASYSQGAFTLRSGGQDFYRAPDGFHYVYQPFTGNATIIARVESIGNTHPYALAGLMIRENLGASASFVAIAVNPSNYTNFMWRQGAGTPGYKAVSGSAPRWIKLSRSGSSFTSAYSADGVNWTAIGEISISMGSSIYVGMALTAQNNTQLNRATFSNVSVTTTTTLCTATGTILKEYWANVSGGTVAAIPVNITPTSFTHLTSFETPSNIGDHYGQRIRGYICAPATGSYTFYLASDDGAELWLSKDAYAVNKEKIAFLTAWTNPKQWTKYASQKSVAVTLEKGKKYYIEALHKEAIYGDHLAVAWTTPTSSSIQVIQGAVLSPFVPSVTRLASEVENKLHGSIKVYPNPFEDKLTISTQGQLGKVVITLTDVVGRVYMEKSCQLSDQEEVSLDLSALPLKAGIHLLKLQTADGQTQVNKVVKK